MGAEKFESLMRRASVTMRSYNDFLIQERPDLSWTLEGLPGSRLIS